MSVSQDDIISVINNLSPNKANGYDGVSVPMLKLCATEVAIPLTIIFDECFRSPQFPDFWKYANVQPVHKKANRQIMSNYRPISLLPICRKILEKIVFDQVYTFLNKNNLSSKH